MKFASIFGRKEEPTSTTKTTVTINGVKHTFEGSTKNISVTGNQVFINGKDVTPEAKKIIIEINGNVDSVVSSSADVLVTGDVNNLQTTSGNVECGDVAGNVKTVSGDVHCKRVNGNVQTVSGNIGR